MNRKIRITAVVAAAAILTAGVVCWSPWKEKTVILRLGMFAGSNWDVPMGNTYAITDEVIKRFEDTHPGVRVEYTSGILKNDYPEWLSEQILLGKTPDVFMIPSEDFNLFSSLGALKDMNVLIKEDKAFSKDKYYQVSYELGGIHGHQYGLPYESVPVLMFVNKTLLEKENISIPENDWTWNDFYEICRRVTRDTDGNGVIDQFGFYDYSWKDAACANGTVIFEENGSRCDLGDSKIEEAVSFVKRLSELNQTYTVTSKEFDMGQVAFRPFAFSEYRTYKPYPWSIKKYSNFEWDCIKLPAGPQGGNVSTVDTLFMGIGADTRKEKLAWELLKMFCYDSQTQVELFRYSQGVSVLREVTESNEVVTLLNQDTPGESILNMTLLNEVMESGTSLPKFRKYEEAMRMADNGIEEIIRGEKSLDNGLLVIQREINNVLRN